MACEKLPNWPYADKTQGFTTQIEVKQRELEPWTAKISEKQSAIDVATSERDLLAEKASSAQTAYNEAKANLEKVKENDGGKKEEYENLKKEKVKAGRWLAEKEAALEVSLPLYELVSMSDKSWQTQSMTSQAEKLRAKVSSSRSKTDEAKASLAADKSENAVLNCLNKLKAQGRVKGFHVSI